jgi:hypothetical protein
MNPKRKPFKIHLSTAVLIMLEIGALLTLNFNGTDHGYFREFGWPVSVYWPSEAMAKVDTALSPALNLLILTVDALVAGAALYATYRVSEQFIRRREARKT